MQLSIEAIIILVIAFVLLGLAIVFVKGFFTQAGDRTDKIIGDTTNACNTATSDNPITPKKFQIQQGGKSDEEICVLNNADTPLVDSQLLLANCIDPDGTSVAGLTTPNAAIKLISAPLDIKRGESKAYQTTIRVNSTTAIGTYICNVIVQKTGVASAPKVGPIQMTFEVV
jgi:hypothetical protein